MSDHSHSAPRRGSFGRVVGLFLLVVIAALVGLYFYSLEARRAGDDAIGQARSYKRTIVADYKRFYECMRSGGAAGSGTTTASADTAKAEGAATPPGPFSANVPEKATAPSPTGVPPTVVADAPAGMVADAPGATAPGEVMTPSSPAQPAAPGPTASSDSAPPAAGLVVYPPYPDYPVYPQAADQTAAHNAGAPQVPSPGQYAPPPQAEARDQGGPHYDTRPAYARGPELAQAPVQPPMADQSAGAAGMPAANTILPQQAWPQQPDTGMQAGTEPLTVAALPAQGTERAAGNYPYRAAPNWQAPGAPPYGAYGYRGTPPPQGPQPPANNRAYSYSGYGAYPYYQRAPAYPQQPQAGASAPGTTAQPGQVTQQRMQPMPPAQGMTPWQGTQSWQAAPPWQGMQSGQGAQGPWQGMQRPYAGMPPRTAMQPAPAAMQPQAGQDGNAQYAPSGQGAQQYAPAADWQAPPGATTYGAGARAELTPNAPPSVRYDQLTASPPPGGPVMQGAAAPRQDPLPPAPVTGATVGGAPPSSYSGAAAPQQWVPYAAAPAPYASAQGYAPQRAPLQPVPSVGAVGSELNPLVASARQAYSTQRYQDAINSYRTLIAKGDDSPAVYGELGNVLLAAGRPQEAAQAYYEASSRLIDKGQPASVYLLLSHIETYDPLLGAILNRRLASLPRSLN